MSPSDPTPNSSEGDVLYVLFLSVKPGKTLTPDVIGQHGAHLAELDREGKLALAGPLRGQFTGLVVLRVGSLDEARAIAEDDPMVRGGFESYELATWAVANKRNNYQPNVRALGKP